MLPKNSGKMVTTSKVIILGTRDSGHGKEVALSRVPDLLSRIPNPRFKIPDARFKIPDFRSKTPDPRFQMVDS
jgi:hypothetical protein